MSDKWVQRTSADYIHGFNSLLPTGMAWPRENTTVFQKVVTGLMKVWGDSVEVLAAILLNIESDPRKTDILLSDWERNWGLPDQNLVTPATKSDRRLELIWFMTLLGAQSREFFIAVATHFGYTVTIREYAPFMCGYSHCGDTSSIYNGGDTEYYRWVIGHPEIRFWWVVKVSALKQYTSSGHDLEYILTRWKPAHTGIVMDYTLLLELDQSTVFNSQYLLFFMM